MNSKSPYMTYMGIDPGKKGCMCLLAYWEHEIVNIHFIPWNENMKNIQIDFRHLINKEIEFPSLCILEKVHAMPKQGVTSSFTFGQGYGKWIAFLELQNIPFRMIPPQQWQKGLVSKKDGDGSIKKAVEVTCNRLFPKHKQLLYNKRGTYQDGCGDALLMAYKAKLIMTYESE